MTDTPVHEREEAEILEHSKLRNLKKLELPPQALLPPQETTTADNQRIEEIRNDLKEQVSSHAATDPTFRQKVEFGIAKTATRFLTSRLFVSNYTDGKGSDDKEETAAAHRLPHRTHGSPLFQSLPHSPSELLHLIQRSPALVKIPLELAKRYLHLPI